MQLYNVIEFKKGLLISAETFEHKEDAIDHYRGIAKMTTIDTSKVTHGTFTVISEGHVAHFVVTSI